MNLTKIHKMPFYHCEYCDRTFLSTKESVKKHNSSKQHLKRKDDYYKRFEHKGKVFVLNLNLNEFQMKKFLINF